MGKSSEKKITDILKNIMDDNGLANELKERNVLSHWADVVGATVANRTTEIYINKKVLFVSVNSSVLRHELLLQKQHLLNRLNESAGDLVINDIVLK